MTDQQLLNVFLKRVVKAVDALNRYGPNVEPKLVLSQQYGKKLYFAIAFENTDFYTNANPWWIRFLNNDKIHVFTLPELPDRLMDWKCKTICEIRQSVKNYVNFDISTAPKEVVHIFFSAIISALNTPGMSIGLTMGCTVFDANETYEEVQIEADLMGFNDDNCW